METVTYDVQLVLIGKPETIDRIGTEIRPLAKLLRSLGKRHRRRYRAVDDGLRKKKKTIPTQRQTRPTHETNQPYRIPTPRERRLFPPRK
jgi:hypothetical protein